MKNIIKKGLNIDKEGIHIQGEKEKLFFAPVRGGVKIPTKRKEDAGLDAYAWVEKKKLEDGTVIQEQLLPKGEVSMIKTGLASAMEDKYFLSAKSERSSVAKLGLNVLAGVIDSGYRGEIAVMVVPLVKDILITSEVDEVEEYEDIILYPVTKAIAQFVLLPVPDVEVETVSYEELQGFSSERGTGGWGSSGK